MFEVLKEEPFYCGISQAYDSIDTSDAYKKRESTRGAGDQSHIFLRVPLVMHTTLSLEVFADLSGREEPDFLISQPPAAGPAAAAGGTSSTSPTSAAGAASSSAAATTGEGASSWGDYEWLNEELKPHWNAQDVASSVKAWVKWIQVCWLRHQRTLFEQCASTNERLQFEYASFLQGFSDEDLQVHVARQESRRVVTLSIPLFQRSEEDQRKWRQLLFRVASTTMEFETEAQRQALMERLEDWKRNAPLQLEYGIVLVLRDDTAFTFSVARESLTFIVPKSEAKESTVELLSGGKVTVDLSALYEQLRKEMSQLLPVDLPSLPVTAPRLAADQGGNPASFIDHIPALENHLVTNLGGDLFHWFDVVQCFSGEFGVPSYCHSFPQDNEPRSAVFSFTDAQSGLGAVLQIIYHNQYTVPEITLTSTQHCLRNDAGPLRIAVSFTDGADGTKQKVMSVLNGRQYVNPVNLSDETKAFIEKVFPRFAQACALHGQSL